MDNDVHEEISRLEAQIEAYAETIERCRKFILAAQIAITVGAVLIVGLVFRLIAFDPLIMVCGLTAVIGGIVALGSNRSTSHQTTAAMQSAEARRAELISGIDLRVVGDGDGGVTRVPLDWTR